MRCDGWQERPFDEIMLIPLRNGLSKPKAIRGTGVKMVNMGELFRYDRIFDIDMDLVPVTSKEFEAAKLEEGDLLFARQSLVREGAGKCSIVMQTNGESVYESHLIRVRIDRSMAEPLFYFYYLKSPQGSGRISSIVEQVAAAGIRGSDLKRLMLPVPSVLEQRAIAATLSCLDDKIELNNRMNKNLEEMAQALFKSWFVDFDPVKAKMEGREPTGMDAETAALFPDEFEDSELGPIPKGWRVDTLGSVVSVNAQSLSKDFPHEMIYYVDINSVSEGSCTWPELAPLHTAPSRARRLVRDGDTIWSMVRPNRRAFLYVCEPDERVVVSTGFAVLSPELVPSSFLHSHVTMSEFSDYLASNADGSAYPAVRPGHFEGARLVLPTDSVLSSFDMLVGPIRRRIHRNQQENANLSSLRDTLLPKLMSGEIRVPEAEDILEEVL